MVTFGQWLRQRRDGLALTRKELTGRVRCSISTLRKIEDGERRPSGQVAELLANCLDIPHEERSAFVRAAPGELSVERLRSESPVFSQQAIPPLKQNLPVFPTPLIGRGRELGQLGQLVADPQCRLLIFAALAPHSVRSTGGCAAPWKRTRIFGDRRLRSRRELLQNVLLGLKKD